MMQILLKLCSQIIIHRHIANILLNGLHTIRFYRYWYPRMPFIEGWVRLAVNKDRYRNPRLSIDVSQEYFLFRTGLISSAEHCTYIIFHLVLVFCTQCAYTWIHAHQLLFLIRTYILYEVDFALLPFNWLHYKLWSLQFLQVKLYVWSCWCFFSALAVTTVWSC